MEHVEAEQESAAYRKELLALGEALSALRNYPVRQAERNRRKLYAYEAKLGQIDRTLEGI